MKFNQADLETVWPFVNIKNKTLLNFFNDRNRQIDSIAQWRHGSAESIAQYAIIRDVIYPLLWVDTEHHQVRNKIPNWSKIQQKLERDFKRFNIGNIMNDVKVTFYKNQREWDRLLEVKMKMMSASTLDTSNPFSIAAFNNLIYGLILPISNDKAVLETAEKWLSKIIAARPNQAGSIDTYANILYKQGKVAEAIFQQERACKLAPNNEAINENYKKMKAGIPTWDYPVDPNVF